MSTQHLTYEQALEEWAYSLGFQACLWGRPLCEYMETIYPGLSHGGSHTNTFRYFDRPKPSSIRFVRTPNNVTIDGYCNGDLHGGPLVIHVPEQTDKRWTIVQVGDMFDTVCENIGGSNGQQPGIYLVTGPDFHGAVAPYMRQIKVRTQNAVIALRVLLNGMADLPAALKVQRSISIMTLAQYQKYGSGYNPGQIVNDPAYYNRFHFVPKVTPALARYEYIGESMKLFLSRNDDFSDPNVVQFHNIGLSVGNGFEPESLCEATKRGLARANEAAEQLIQHGYTHMVDKAQNWNYIYTDGKSDNNLALRASLATFMPGGNLAEQIIYGNTWEDADGQPLNGTNKYILHFDKDQLPPARVFWNLAMYASDMLFVQNDFIDASGDEYGRCTIGSTTDGIQYDADGGITLLIQHERPTQTANWLPAPADIFNLTLRMYGPDMAVLGGQYRLPAVNRVK